MLPHSLIYIIYMFVESYKGESTLLVSDEASQIKIVSCHESEFTAYVDIVGHTERSRR